jgi:DNA-binding NarL/FixJ family response regulator
MTTNTAKDRKTIHIALVEDDDGTLRNLRRMLASDEGCLCVGGFRTVQEATDAIPRLQPDVVLVDVNLPDGTGVDAVRTLAPMLPETEFVMLTIYQDGDILFDALSAGAHGYLIKPVRTEQLLAAIHDVLEGGAPMSNVVARRIVRSFEPDKSLPPPEPLGPREREVLQLLADGLGVSQISRQLFISDSTTKTHISKLYDKLGAGNRAQALMTALRLGLLEAPDDTP